MHELIDDIADIHTAAARAVTRPSLPSAFAAAPGMALPSDILNYESSLGLKIYEQGQCSLPTKWAVDSEGAETFCEELRQRAMTMGSISGTNSILTIEVTSTSGTTTRHNLITQSSMVK